MNYPQDDVQVSPPFNLEAEEATLGAVLIDPEAYYSASTIVQAEDFYAVKHQWIWEAYSALAASSHIDLLTLKEELFRHNRFDEVGGSAYLTKLMTSTPTAWNVDSYAQLVVDFSTRRKALSAAHAISREAYDLSISTEEFESQFTKHASEVFTSHEKGTETIADVGNEWLGDMYDVIENGNPDCIDWGTQAMSKHMANTTGVRGDYITLAAAPGMGKTVSLIQIAEENGVKIRDTGSGESVLYVSLEMSAKQLYGRMISRHTGLSSAEIGNPEGLSQIQIDAIRRAVTYLDSLPIVIYAPPTSRFETIVNKIRAFALRNDLRLVLLDYLGLLQTSVSDQRHLKFVHITGTLKSLCRHLNITIVQGCQISRNDYDGEPNLGSLADSRSIEQDSDCVIFIYPHEQADENSMYKSLRYFKIAKNRNGKEGRITTVFLGASQRFADAATEELDYSNA